MEQNENSTARVLANAVRDEDPQAWGHQDAMHSAPRPPAGPTDAPNLSAINTEPPVRGPTASIGATFLGWTVAAFFTVVFSAIALSVAGGGAAVDGQVSLNTLAWGSLVGYLVASFLAYVIGGYAAGRMSLWNGVAHGLGTVAWGVAFALAGALFGAYLSNVFDLTMGVELSGLTGYAVLAILLSLLAMAGGAALGGRMGERYHTVRPGATWRGRTVGKTRRGRPL